MKAALAIFCFMCISYSAHADVPTAKIECSGLSTVGMPIDPGYNLENHGLSELKVSADTSGFNKCDGNLNCWLTGDASMTFVSAPGIEVLLKVVAVQEKPNGPIKVSSLVAKLVAGNKILAVSQSYGASISLINPGPYQILKDLGEPNMGIYQGFDKGLLKGKLLSEVSISCSVVN